jgi:HrpA-like RNA helicase
MPCPVNLLVHKWFMPQAEYKKMCEGRQQLPAWNERQRIVQVLEQSQVVVISGMTGCGKRCFYFLLIEI